MSKLYTAYITIEANSEEEALQKAEAMGDCFRIKEVVDRPRKVVDPTEALQAAQQGLEQMFCRPLRREERDDEEHRSDPAENFKKSHEGLERLFGRSKRTVTEP
jgi:hypothetical protein